MQGKRVCFKRIMFYFWFNNLIYSWLFLSFVLFSKVLISVFLLRHLNFFIYFHLFLLVLSLLQYLSFLGLALFGLNFGWRICFSSNFFLEYGFKLVNLFYHWNLCLFLRRFCIYFGYT
jgi:hypothetical protein